MAEETKTPETNQAETQQEQQAEQTTRTYTEQEYNALMEQLNTANATIQSYKDIGY